MGKVRLIGMECIDKNRRILGSEFLGHTWELDEDGKVDYNAFTFEEHSGLQCSKCGYQFCEHCFKPENVAPCKYEDDQP